MLDGHSAIISKGDFTICISGSYDIGNMYIFAIEFIINEIYATLVVFCLQTLVNSFVSLH